MLGFLHSLFWGHHYVKDPGELCFECRCGEHWWPGFTHYGPGRRDTFEKWVA